MYYKCEVCGATKEGEEAPVCCDKPMVECKEDKNDSSCCSCCG